MPLDPGVGAAPRAGRVWPALSGDPDTAPRNPRLLEGAASGRRGSGRGGVLESPAVEGRCGRLPHKGGGGGGKAGRGGPGAGEAGRGGGGGGGGDKAPAQPGRLVLWLHGSAGLHASPPPVPPTPAAALSSLRAPTATWGSKRGRVSTGCAVPAAGRGAGDRPRGCAATGRRGGNFLGPPGPLLRARRAPASPIPEGWGAQVCPRLREPLAELGVAAVGPGGLQTVTLNLRRRAARVSPTPHFACARPGQGPGDPLSHWLPLPQQRGGEQRFRGEIQFTLAFATGLSILCSSSSLLYIIYFHQL